MLKGKNVRVRLRRNFEEQKPWVFVGKVDQMSENWLALTGKGILIIRGKTRPVEIDDELRQMVIPRDNIANVRVLPDDFGLDEIEVFHEGIRVGIGVKGAPNTWIGELGES